MCPHSETPSLPPSPSHPSGSSQCTSPERPVSCIEHGLVIYFTYGNIHVSMLFSQIIPLLPSPRESKSLFFIAVSILLSRIQGHCYHLSKFHILSRVQPSATPWTSAFQAPPSMGFSRQKYWSGVPLPSPPIQYTNTYIWNLERW